MQATESSTVFPLKKERVLDQLLYTYPVQNKSRLPSTLNGFFMQAQLATLLRLGFGLPHHHHHPRGKEMLIQICQIQEIKSLIQNVKVCILCSIRDKANSFEFPAYPFDNFLVCWLSKNQQSLMFAHPSIIHHTVFSQI